MKLSAVIIDQVTEQERDVDVIHIHSAYIGGAPQGPLAIAGGQQQQAMAVNFLATFVCVTRDTGEVITAQMNNIRFNLDES